jgi:uncharacterized protein with von Willebrand factor type A (vWA) domain
VKSRLLQFIECLRGAGLRITPAETTDAARAVAAIGVEPVQFREALAATLVKDEADRAAFDQEFDRFFAASDGSPGKRKRSRPAGDGQRSATPRESRGDARLREQREKREAPSPRATESERERSETAERRRRMSDLRSLLNVPLKELTPDQIEDSDVLLAELAKCLRTRARRRRRAARRGRLDLRRTVRRSVGSGGVPVFPQWRRRRPGRPDLVALCDMSHSIAVATRFLLTLLAPAAEYYRRVRLFGYVDAPVEIWLQDGHLVQDQTLDLYARSDFGKVLSRFWEEHATLLTRNTVLLVLGDARNNRRPPRADLFARLGSLVREVVWLNPEPRERWDSGDSVQSAYTPHCGVVMSAGTLRELYAAVKILGR